MFPLSPGPWPGNVPQLQQRLSDGMQGLVKASPRVVLAGEWPILQGFTMDLGGICIDPSIAWPEPRPGIERLAGPACRQLRVFADPLQLGDLAKPQFHLKASDLQFQFLRDDAGRHWLVPMELRGGTLHAQITGNELNLCFLEVSRTLAKAQGITVENARVNLEPAGPNAVKIEAEVGARKSFLKGRVRFIGIAEVGSALDVQLRGLKCEGLGAIGSMAARAVQPYLDRFSARPLRPLGALFAGLKLEHLDLQRLEDDKLMLNASIASSSG